MSITVRSALNLATQQINVAMTRFLSYFQIWTPTLSLSERTKLRQKAARKLKEKPKTQRVVMPSKLITDPSFGYVNSALTDVSATWKKHSTGVKNAGLFNNPNADRENDKEVRGEVPTQKIRRVQ
mgnify:CR=1 FL=1|jgi:hypothetical protein